MLDFFKRWFAPKPAPTVNNAPPAVPLLPNDLPWITHARQYLGLREIPGPEHNTTILGWWGAIGAAFRDDETPWCGAFVGGVLVQAGRAIIAGGASARAWLKMPVALSQPAYGCIVVFWRGSPSGASGHVGFVVGQDKFGNLMVLGGNQGDIVSIKPFPRNRVLGYRWPGAGPAMGRYNLPLLDSDGKVSTNEA